MHDYRAGELIEYSDHYFNAYPPQDQSLIKFGVATGEKDDRGMPIVETVNGLESARYVYASDWSGWVPEGLESILEKYQVNDWSENEW